MAVSEHEVEIAVGRRATDGHVRVSVFAPELLALTLEGTGERAPTMLLTIEQARGLEHAIARLIPLIEASTRESQTRPDTSNWQGKERRAQ
jgi:hypothetical protein